MLSTRAEFLGLNRVVGLGSESPLTEALLDEVIGEYRDAGVTRVAFQLSELAIRDGVDQLLRARGMVATTRHAKLWRRPGTPVAAATDLRVIEIDSASADVYGKTVAHAYGDPPILAAGHSATVGRAAWRHFLAFDGGQAVAGAALFRSRTSAWCGFAATLPEYRGRGAHSALLALRLNAAAQDGCTLVTCETLEDTAARPNSSFRNMRRAGFEVAYFRPNYIWSAQGS